ncbi:ArsR/SmtB family transcription factor [Camelimonas abortus]|uniref:ArsR/SmtB family transcription factor n=1 Tax=Camelimonas abortus TaxID=1017184 RepID=A0ABV7LGC5_9HYPH
MSQTDVASFEQVLAALRAAAEETRLRILRLLSHGEFSVSDLTDILGQSQPRISRHLRLLCDAGLVERRREGAWAFFRLADGAGFPAPLRALVEALPADDPLLARDAARLVEARAERARVASAWFARLAPEWDRLRSLHAPEALVEDAILALLGPAPVRALLDLGAGTGRMLQLLAPQAQRLVGVDASPAMLQVARANLERAGITRAELRQGDINALDVERGAFDLVTMHQVLHFLDDPGRAVREAAQALAPGGRLLVVDFATHEHEFLRDRHQHRRLGFDDAQMAAWFAAAGLEPGPTRRLSTEDAPRGGAAGRGLTVVLWLARRRAITDGSPDGRNSGTA